MYIRRPLYELKRIGKRKVSYNIYPPSHQVKTIKNFRDPDRILRGGVKLLRRKLIEIISFHCFIALKNHKKYLSLTSIKICRIFVILSLHQVTKMCLFVSLLYIIPLENILLPWRRHVEGLKAMHIRPSRCARSLSCHNSCVLWLHLKEPVAFKDKQTSLTRITTGPDKTIAKPK